VDGVFTLGIKENVGCINNTGLQVFHITADGRYRISRDLFFKTHFPMKIRRQSQAETTLEITEQQLLDELLDVDTVGVRGENRVYFLFGATGSGKSELSKWLEEKLKETPRGNVVHRVSKTELDLPIIVQKFNEALDQDNGVFSEEIREKQKEIGRIPEQTASLLLYQSIYGKLSDERAQLFIDTIKPLLAKGIKNAFNPKKIDEAREEERGETIHPLLKEHFENALKDTGLLKQVGYEELNKDILNNIEKLYLGNTKLVNTLENLSNKITADLNTRPVLLIDDIVQSMSFYVVSLLDYFMDFSRGHWDVVIGITPHSLEITQQGKEILTRITQQNTITERSTTLMLSDKVGNESYVINSENCVDFIRPYILEYKKYNKFQCNSNCEYYGQCCLLSLSIEAETSLSPFNEILIKRIFNNLPKMTGQSRSIILTIRNLLRKIEEENDIIRAIENESVIQNSFRAYYPSDRRIENIVEFYLPSTTEEYIEVPRNMLKFFDIAHSDEKVHVKIIPFEGNGYDEGDDETEGPPKPPDPVKLVINDWIDGKELTQDKIQQLIGLRQGAVSVIEEFVKPNILGLSNSPSLSGSLKWQGRIQETDPPIKLEGIDDHHGIVLNTSIETLAFLLYEYRRSNKRVDIRDQIVVDDKLGVLIDAGYKFREKCIRDISNYIEMDLDQLVLYMYILSVSFNGPYGTHPPINFEKYSIDYIFNDTPGKLPYGLGKYNCELSPFQRENIELMFNDFFLLRKNVYDGFRINELLRNTTIFDIIEEISTINVIGLQKQYKIGTRIFEEFIEAIKNKVERLSDLQKDKQAESKLNEFNRIKKIIDSTSVDSINLISKIFSNLIDELIENDILLKLFESLNYKYNFDEFNLVDLKEWIKNIFEHYYDILINQRIRSPTMFLRFLYEYREMEDEDFVKWIISFDKELSSIEENIINMVNVAEQYIVKEYDNLKQSNYNIYDYLDEYKDYMYDLFDYDVKLSEYEKINELGLLDEIPKNIDSVDLLDRSTHINNMIKYIIRLDRFKTVIVSYNENINLSNIRQILSWSVLFESLDSELNIDNQYKFWSDLVTDNLPFNQDTIDTVLNLNKEMMRHNDEITLLQNSNYQNMDELLEEKQKVWEIIDLLKQKVPKLVDIFPVFTKDSRSLIRTTSSLDYYNPDEVYKLARAIKDYDKKIESPRGEEGALSVLRRGLSDEAYRVFLEILRDRKSIPLNEIDLSYLQEIQDQFPELVQLIGISLKI